MDRTPGARDKRKRGNFTGRNSASISRELSRKTPFSPSSCSRRAVVPTIIAGARARVCVFRPHGRERASHKDNHLFGSFSYIDTRARESEHINALFIIHLRARVRVRRRKNKNKNRLSLRDKFRVGRVVVVVVVGPRAIREDGRTSACSQ